MSLDEKWLLNTVFRTAAVQNGDTKARRRGDEGELLRRIWIAARGAKRVRSVPLLNSSHLIACMSLFLSLKNVYENKTHDGRPNFVRVQFLKLQIAWK